MLILASYHNFQICSRISSRKTTVGIYGNGSLIKPVKSEIFLALMQQKQVQMYVLLQIKTFMFIQEQQQNCCFFVIIQSGCVVDKEYCGCYHKAYKIYYKGSKIAGKQINFRADYEIFLSLSLMRECYLYENIFISGRFNNGCKQR